MQVQSSWHGPERRRWPRIPASLLVGVSAAFVNGPDVTLVNLSCGGALIEVSARYPMKAFVRLKLARSTGAVTTAAGTVLWSKVNSIVNGQVSYLMAVAFDKPIADMEGATGIRIGESETPASLPSVTPPEYLDVAIPGEQTIATDADVPVVVTGPPLPAETMAREDRHEQPASLQVEAEQQRWSEEKSRLVLELTSATARADALRTALEALEQEQQQASREQHDRYQTIIADMARTATDQQVELSRQRGAAESQRTDFESRIRELQAQLQALEIRCAAHEGRHRVMQQEVERLASILATPIDPPVDQQDAITTFRSPPAAAHVA
jgi:hypothetical protein